MLTWPPALSTCPWTSDISLSIARTAAFASFCRVSSTKPTPAMDGGLDGAILSLMYCQSEEVVGVIVSFEWRLDYLVHTLRCAPEVPGSSELLCCTPSCQADFLTHTLQPVPPAQVLPSPLPPSPAEVLQLDEFFKRSSATTEVRPRTVARPRPPGACHRPVLAVCPLLDLVSGRSDGSTRRECRLPPLAWLKRRWGWRGQ